MGDEGSGYRIGMSALHVIARGKDGRGRSTALRDPVLNLLGVAGPPDLIKWMATAMKADVASLVPLIDECAAGGDPVATAVIEEAVGELVLHVRTLMGRLEPWPASPEVALAGGLIEEGGPLRARVAAAIEALDWRLLKGTPDGARGACSLAMALA